VNHVCVKNRVGAEYEAAENRISQVHGTIERKEDGNNASHCYQQIKLAQFF
jgi:hypothetical protein